ncbi:MULTISPECIES: M1 family metallopeptidase [unclassified Nocardioides]|uniref:M1 family metallopeptidase n=1 Tax=unclassified Nocardioides TaxID=2615069 RepID=UPI0011230221|nr:MULTISPECIES: M1 family metallopeptidase [unclassified Nocardioides]
MRRAAEQRRRRTATLLASGLLAAALVAGCTSEDDQPPTPSAQASPAPTSSTSSDPAEGGRDAAQGYSTPVEDRVYPDVGDPGVDALHYDLRLTWDPDRRTLDGTETVELRATTDADHLQLDLAGPLEVTGLMLDGADAAYRHRGKDLVVDAPVTRDSRHTLVIEYTGRPGPVPAPVQRKDFSETGWTVTDDGGAWTMQEPYGAYSWYAVNDQPSDKALYDFTLRVPAPFVGVANGELLSRERARGDTVTRWRLDAPASSYLVTVAFGDLTETTDESQSGVPISYWTPADRPDLLQRVRRAPEALAWLEDRLGPYPFDTLGILVVDSKSGMETQTMITLGDTTYATSPEVLVHEIAHQWYGDLVTPVDWRDVWMSEGMATYLQGAWMAEDQGVTVTDVIDYWATFEDDERAKAGPPADYDPAFFGSSNVYYGPALMWDELRQRLGDEEFWALVRAWPGEHADGNADYADITSWWSAQSGVDLSGFFDDWLLGATTPDRG